MASFTTVLADNGNTANTWNWVVSANHSTLKPFLVLQKRKIPTGNQVMAEDTLSVLTATTDAEGVVLSQRVLHTYTCRRPVTGDDDDVTASLAVFRDLINSDEVTAMVAGSLPIQ